MREEDELQQEKVNTLIRLMKENPTLRVLPMVNTEVVGGDDYSWWTGVFGVIEIDECWSDDERMYIKSTDYEELVDIVIEGLETYEKLKGFSIEQLTEIAENEVDNLKWEKVISLGITT